MRIARSSSSVRSILMICLDTDILIGLMRGDPGLKEVFERNSREELVVAPVTLCEVYRGAHLYSRPLEELARIESVTADLGLLDFGHESCRRFGEVYSILKKRGRMPQEADLMIASICLEHGASLVTRNTDDFKNIPGLKLIVW